MDKRIDNSYQASNESVETNPDLEVVDFESELPVIEEDDLEFLPAAQGDEDLGDADTDEI